MSIFLHFALHSRVIHIFVLVRIIRLIIVTMSVANRTTLRGAPKRIDSGSLTRDVNLSRKFYKSQSQAGAAARTVTL